MKPKKIEISHRTIVFSVTFLACLWFLYFIREIILQIFVALLIMAILNPTVTKLHKKLKMPRFLSVIIVYFLVFGGFISVLTLAIPPLISQTSGFANNLPKYISEFDIPNFLTNGLTQEFASQIGSLPSQLIKITVSIFSNVLSVLAVFIFALYFLLAREKLDDNLGKIFSDAKIENKIKIIFERLEIKLGGWARGQIFLMIIIGVSTYIGLTLLGIPYALPLALFAGLLEIIPNIGPFLSSVPAIIVGFGISPLTGVAVAALYVLIQNVENYVFVPKIMEKSAGVHPLVTLLSLLIGFKIAGVMGALLSVPIVITIQVILGVVYSEKFD